MALPSKSSKPLIHPDSEQALDAALHDLRFRTLLSDDDWKRLPPATRQRFSKRLADGSTAVYVGEVTRISFSRAGWWLAQIARLIGGPLPTSTDTHVPEYRDGDRRCGDERPDLDAYLRAPERVSSGHSLIETFRRTHGS
jgi:hypothetical protein